jgi:ADP-ribosyl-[dinitrogen reductase] hydrolase
MGDPRYRGCLLGLATGDALGTTLEFSAPGTFASIDDMVGGGPFRLRPGEWTDDTSMALCLAESLVECGGFDPVDQLERYVRWYRQGHLSSNGRCFDIGTTVREALVRFEETRAPYCGPTDPGTAGNGSLMRLAPVPLFFARRPGEAVDRAADSSRTTHQAREAVDACRYLAALLVGAVRGAGKADLLADHFEPVSGLWAARPLTATIAEVARGSFRRRDPPAIRGSGHVVRSLEAALWALHRSETFAEGLLLAVNLGDDADTTGAVYGQLAGALSTDSGIPSRWLATLSHRAVITRLADDLAACASMLTPE